MYCSQCGTKVDEQVSFCGNCGGRLDGKTGSPAAFSSRFEWKGTAGDVMGNVAQSITSVAGLDHLEGLNGKELLGGVFKRRSDDDVEELFITGTRSTTPPLEQIETEWPKPWAFFKALITSLILFGGFYYGVSHFGCFNLLPGLIFVGSFGIPFSTLIFFVEVNVARNISVYQVLKLVFIGGMFALLITLFLYSVVNTDGSWIFTGVVEEAGKLLAVIWLMRKSRFTWTLNGLLIGAAVGTGFAAFESAGYALQGLFNDVVNSIDGESTNVMLSTMAGRALLAPAGHIVWTAIASAALWKVKGAQPFKWEMLKDLRFVRAFLLVVAFHTLWDSPFIAKHSWWAIKDVSLGVVAWIVVLAYIQDGLRQIKQAQQDALTEGIVGTEATSPTTAE